MLEQELFDLLSGTSDAAFAITELFEICSWNKAAEKLFGYSAADAIKKNCQSLLQGRGVLGIQAWGNDSGVRESAAKHLDIPDFDLDVKIRSGRRIWVNVSTLLFGNPRKHRRLIRPLCSRYHCQKEKRGTAPQDDGYFASAGKPTGHGNGTDADLGSFGT